MIPTTLGVALVIFTLYHAAPGDPATVMMGNQTQGSAGADSDTESKIDKFRRKHNLDRNLVVQFLDYIGPFNLSPDGHPWFSSPRTERVTKATEVTDSDSGVTHTIDEGLPIEVEHLVETPPEERKRLDAAVTGLLSAASSDGERSAAIETLRASPSKRALPPMMAALFHRRLAGADERESIARVIGGLETLTGAAPELDPQLTERDGQRHSIKRWFAWYYANGGYRTQNSGAKKWGGLLALDLGVEMQSKLPVADELVKRLKVTVPLAGISVLLSYLIALPLGIFSVRRQGTMVDGSLTIGLFVLYSVPTFWMGLMLILVMGKTGLDLLPILGLHDKDADSYGALRYAWDTFLHMILPIATLTYGSLAYLSRQMRAGMLDVIRQDYIRTARAKGLSDDVVIYKHALRNSMIPVLTLLASILPILIGGSVIVELVFNIHGMGLYAFTGLTNLDFYVVMATTLFVGIMTQFGILFSDITYSLADPRIRLK